MHWPTHCTSAIVSSVIIVIWAALLTSIVLYSVELGKNTESGDNNNTKTTSRNDSVCVPAVYTGTLCKHALQSYQNCQFLKNFSSAVLINSQEETQAAMEERVQRLLEGLRLLQPSMECESLFQPFLCLYIFGLCDSSGQLYLPSSGECRMVTEETCALEFQAALRIVGPDVLPQCEGLPDVAMECTGNGGELEVQTDNSRGSNVTTICSEQFYLDVSLGVCKPECGKFSIYSAEVKVLMNCLIIMSLFTGIIGGTVVWVLSCFNCKQAFMFPSALVRYQTASISLFDLVLLVGYTDGEGLFCSSRNLMESSTRPTPFCTITGIVFYYFHWQGTAWWFLHILAMFWGLRFPFQAHKFDATGKTKRLHLAVISLGLLLPCFPVIVLLSTGGFSFLRYPPLLCSVAESESAIFYAAFLPVGIVDAAGFTLLLLIFWTVYRERRCNTSKMQSRIPEMKILIILSYFLGIGIYVLIVVEVFFLNGNQLEQHFANYILCESIGTQTANSCNEEKTQLNKLMAFQVCSDIAYMLLAVVPTVNLIYIIHIRRLKQQCMICCPRKSTEIKKVEKSEKCTQSTQIIL